MATKGVKLLEMPSFPDARGSLSVIEGANLPFTVRRIYYLYDVPIGAIRGEHAHRELEQIIMCMHGKVVVHVSDGEASSSFTLEDPSKVLHVRPGIWRSLKFVGPDSVVCVLASREYEVEDYIHDYEEYMRWVSQTRKGS